MNKEKEWKIPPHYVLVKEGIVPADSKSIFAVKNGNLYKVDYTNSEYQKWAAERAAKKKALREKRLARLKKIAERKAVKKMLQEMRKMKKEKVRELNNQIKALQNVKKNV